MVWFISGLPLMGAEEVSTFRFPDPPLEKEKNFFSIAEKGIPKCVVVIPSFPGKKIPLFAADFCTYLKLSTGATFELISEDQPIPAGMGAIHLGDTKVAQQVVLNLPDVNYGTSSFLNLNGFLVKTPNRQTLVIRALTENALSHGIVGFLKRYLGIRQYWTCEPGGIGDVIPPHFTLSIPDVEWRDWPYYFHRTSTGERPLSGRTPALSFRRDQNTMAPGESYFELLPPAKYAKSHPEYYSLVGGTRKSPADNEFNSWQPCVSNPEVVRIVAEEVITYFKANPLAVSRNVAINDGGGDCTCLKCREMDAPNSNYALGIGMCDRYMKFTNQVCERVAKEFPNKAIVFLAYATTFEPPVREKLHPMMVPVIAMVAGNAFTKWDGWMACGPQHMGYYFYHDDHFMFVLPKYDVHQSAKRLRYGFETGRARVFYQEMGTYFPLDAMVPYISTELAWDPRVDVEPILQEFYTGFYGPASGKMKEFYDAMEKGYERWLQEHGLPHAKGKDLISTTDRDKFKQFNVLNPEELKSAMKALEEALVLAKNESLILNRISLTKKMMDLIAPAVETYWICKNLESAKPSSLPEANGVIESARKVYEHFHFMGQYANTVLEKPDPQLLVPLFKSTGRHENATYNLLKKGEPGTEAMASINMGLDSVNKHLLSALGHEKSVLWWEDVLRGEKNPVLANIFRLARIRSSGKALQVVWATAFNEAATALTPPASGGKPSAPDIVITPELEKEFVSKSKIENQVWFPEKCPDRRLALTRSDRLGAGACLSASGFARARLRAGVPAGEKARNFRISFWFKHNPVEAIYTCEVAALLNDGKVVPIAAPQISGTEDQWEEVLADVTVPENTKRISLYININKQGPGAMCWLDQLTIYQYPD